MKKDNQQERLLKFLDTHFSITRMEAFEILGITELPKRVSELRQKGYPIGDQWLEVMNRFGEKTRVKEYFKINE